MFGLLLRHLRQHPLLALALALALTTPSAPSLFAQDSALEGNKREDFFNFKVDTPLVSQTGRFQFFFAVLDQNLKIIQESDYDISTIEEQILSDLNLMNLEERLAVDRDSTPESSTSRAPTIRTLRAKGSQNGGFYTVVSKLAYTLKLPEPAAEGRWFMDPSFMDTTNLYYRNVPDANLNSIESSPNVANYQLIADVSHFGFTRRKLYESTLPETAKARVRYYPHDEFDFARQEKGMHHILSLDAEHGEPDGIVLTQHYDFATKDLPFFIDGGAGERKITEDVWSYMKFYALSENQILVIDYKLLYMHLLPYSGMASGLVSKSMRVAAEEDAPVVAQRMEAFRPSESQIARTKKSHSPSKPQPAPEQR